MATTLLSARNTISSYTSLRAQAFQERYGKIIPDLIDQTVCARNAGRQDSIEFVSNLVLEWEGIKSESRVENRERGGLFNPLKSIPLGETTHSRLLGMLLDPAAPHGQNSLFLELFLAKIGVPDPAAGSWQITVEQGRIDILLRRRYPPCVVIIENKSNDAVDQANQLYRYWHQAIHQFHPDLDYGSEDTLRSFQILYLSAGEFKTPPAHARTRPSNGIASDPRLPDSMPLEPILLSFDNQIASWLKQCLHEIPPSNTRLRAFIEFYIEFWTLL